MGKLALSRLQIGHMDCSAIDNGAPGYKVAIYRPHRPNRPLPGRPVLSHEPKHVTFDAHDFRVSHIEQTCGAFGNGPQHRLDIGGRIANNAQDLGGGSLLLTRVVQLAREQGGIFLFGV